MNRQTIIVIVSILVDALQNIYFCAVFLKDCIIMPLTIFRNIFLRHEVFLYYPFLSVECHSIFCTEHNLIFHFPSGYLQMLFSQ